MLVEHALVPHGLSPQLPMEGFKLGFNHVRVLQAEHKSPVALWREVRNQ